MPRLLVINPNTTESVTRLLERHVKLAVGPQVEVTTVTARFGAPYIACEASYAVAGHAALDAWADAVAGPAGAPDAVLVGCFGDPGLLALRECSSAPVSGLAEAAFFEAAWHGRFAVVTGGTRWRPMLQRLADSLGFRETLSGIHTVAPTGAELAANPDWAQDVMIAACREALKRHEVQALIMGGAGLAGLAALVQPCIPVPVIDSVLAGTRQSLARLARKPAREDNGFLCQWTGVGPTMTGLALPGLSVADQPQIRKSSPAS